MTTNGNGNGWKTWALGIAVSLAGAFGTVAWASMASKVDALAAETSQRAERQARTEAEIGSLKESVNRMENKIDILLEHRRGR